MSRIGKLPIAIPAGVTVTVSNENLVTVKGPKGTLTQQVDKDIEIALEDGKLLVKRPTDQKRHRALHGLYRALLNNMVFGVSTGYVVKLELVGVGYRAEAQKPDSRPRVGIFAPHLSADACGSSCRGSYRQT